MSINREIMHVKWLHCRSKVFWLKVFFSCGHANPWEAISVRWSVGPSIRGDRVKTHIYDAAVEIIYACVRWGRGGVPIGVVRPCPPVRNDIVIPRHLFWSWLMSSMTLSICILCHICGNQNSYLIQGVRRQKKHLYGGSTGSSSDYVTNQLTQTDEHGLLKLISFPSKPNSCLVIYVLNKSTIAHVRIR